MEYADEDYVFVTKSDGAGNHDLYLKENLVARNIEQGSMKKTEYGDDFVFAYQVKDNDGFYKLVIFDGKNIKELGGSLDLEYKALSSKKIIYRTKGDSIMFDIKMFNGRKSKTYKDGITDYMFIPY